MSRNVEVTNGEKDQVGESSQGTESGCAVLNDLDNPIESFGNGIGKGTFNEGENIFLMKLERGGKGAHGRQTGLAGRTDPLLEKGPGRGDVSGGPEIFKLVLQSPSAVNTAVRVAGLVQQ